MIKIVLYSFSCIQPWRDTKEDYKIWWIYNKSLGHTNLLAKQFVKVRLSNMYVYVVLRWLVAVAWRKYTWRIESLGHSFGSLPNKCSFKKIDLLKAYFVCCKFLDISVKKQITTILREKLSKHY